MKQVRRQLAVETFTSPCARVCKCVREKMDGGKQQYIEQRQSNKLRMLVQLAMCVDMAQLLFRIYHMEKKKKMKIKKN